MRTITLHPPAIQSQPYPILIGEGSIRELPKLIRTFGHIDSIVILCDEKLKNVAEKLKKQLKASCSISIQSGEQSKSFRQVERIVAELLKNGATRQSLIINLGGGMVTDLGGFVASIYMRGIPFINVPTTLLGMVDASIGGKTGINFEAAKNIIGQYHHPKAVVIDIDMLTSLSEAQFCEGLVEVIKIAAIADAAFFEKLEDNLLKIIARDKNVLCSCISDAVRLKAQIVSEDEKDEGKRLMLNFGHTVSHALEVVSGYRLSHGEAVSIGIVKEMSLAKTKDAARVVALLQQIEMPTEFPANCAMSDLMKAMKKDKKIIRQEIRFVAPKKIGTGAIMNLSKKQR